MLKCSTAVTATECWQGMFGVWDGEAQIWDCWESKNQQKSCLHVSCSSRRAPGTKSLSNGNAEGRSQTPRCCPAAGKTRRGPCLCLCHPLVAAGSRPRGARGTASLRHRESGGCYATLHKDPARLIRGPHRAQSGAGSAGTVGAGFRRYLDKCYARLPISTAGDLGSSQCYLGKASAAFRTRDSTRDSQSRNPRLGYHPRRYWAASPAAPGRSRPAAAAGAGWAASPRPSRQPRRSPAPVRRGWQHPCDSCLRRSRSSGDSRF